MNKWNLKKKDLKKNLKDSSSKLARAAGLTTKGVIQIPPTIAASIVCKAISTNIFLKLAIRKGLEPSTSCVTGRHSNQTELPDREL